MPELPTLDRDGHPAQSQSFVLRVWLENLGDGHTEWRGKVQCISSGEAHYFRDWPTLIAALEGMLSPALTRTIQSPTPGDAALPPATGHVGGSP